MTGLTKEKQRKCAKCGSSPSDDPSVKLHRFPQPNKANKPRCELWAKFCFPKNAWQSSKFQNKLYREHKMLCDKHFKTTSIQKDNVENKKDCNMMQDNNSADVEIVEIKMELDEEIIYKEHCAEATSPEVKKTKSQPLEKGSEESAEIHEFSKTKIIDTWGNEPTKISQKDFDDTYDEWFSQTSKHERNDDCQLYGRLLTKKLRTYSVHERNLLMYKIDGLLIENPPGFDTTSSQSISTLTSNKPESKVKQTLKKKASSTSPAIEKSCINNLDKVMSSSSKLKRKRPKKESLSQQAQTCSQNEDPCTIGSQVTSTSMPTVSPVKTDSDIPLPAVTNSIPKQPDKVTSKVPHQPVKVTSIPVKRKSSIQYQQIKVTSSIPNQSVKVMSSIPNKLVKVMSTSGQPALPSKSTSVPSHLPLQITIPETKIVPITQSKFVATAQPKGKIVIMKTKSAKYVPSSQPPILITIPSLPCVGNYPMSAQCDMNSLEQLSSIAVTRASQAQSYNSSLKTDDVEMADDMNVVSHEVILSASSNSPSQNIVETALKNANIEDEYVVYSGRKK